MAEEETLTLSDDDAFVLRSPQKRNSLYTVDVVHIGDSDVFKASLSHAFYGEGFSMAEALHQLANKLDAANLYGSERKQTVSARELKPCQYCGAQIYFAMTPKGKWMPVDSMSVSAAHAGDMRTFLVTEVAGQYRVQFGSDFQGQVWFAHPEVCGINSTPPKSAWLRARWEDNQKTANQKTADVMQGLQALLHDLEEENDVRHGQGADE